MLLSASASAHHCQSRIKSHYVLGAPIFDATGALTGQMSWERGVSFPFADAE
jgi:hypothetical protein